MNIFLTPSMVEDLQACPFAFQQKHLKRTVKTSKFERTPATQLGNIVHGVLDTFHKRGSHTQLGLDDLLRLLEQKWDGSVYEDYEEELAHRKMAQLMLTDFYQKTQGETPCQDRQSEKFHEITSLRLGQHKLQLRGKFDRLDIFADGTVELIDYKTGSPSSGLPDEKELGESLANLLYYRLVLDLYPNATSVVISHYYLGSKRKVSVRYTSTIFQAAKDHLLGLLDQLEEGIAPPLENQGCAWCLVRRHGKCPRFKQETLPEPSSDLAMQDF